MRKGWRPSEVIFFKTGLKAFLLMVVAGLKSGKIVVWHCSVRISPDKPAEHLSGSPICHAFLVHGRWEYAADRSLSLRHTRDALRWSPPPPLATPPAVRYSFCSYPQYPSSSRWVAPADFLSPWLSSYPHAQLLERNQPGHVSASQQ